MILTATDRARLRRFLSTYREVLTRELLQVEMLQTSIERAAVADQDEVPMSAVTLHTTVRFRDMKSGREQVHTIVLPSDVEIARKHASPLSWVSAVLLGAREGEQVEWQSPEGPRRLRVEEVLSQPQTVRRRVRSQMRRKRPIRRNKPGRASVLRELRSGAMRPAPMSPIDEPDAG